MNEHSSRFFLLRWIVRILPDIRWKISEQISYMKRVPQHQPKIPGREMSVSGNSRIFYVKKRTLMSSEIEDSPSRITTKTLLSRLNDQLIHGVPVIPPYNVNLQSKKEVLRSQVHPRMKRLTRNARIDHNALGARLLLIGP